MLDFYMVISQLFFESWSLFPHSIQIKVSFVQQQHLYQPFQGYTHQVLD